MDLQAEKLDSYEPRLHVSRGLQYRKQTKQTRRKPNQESIIYERAFNLT